VSTTSARPRGIGAALGLVVLLSMVGGGMFLVTLLSTLVWPGQVKVVAPLLCPDDQPDAFVVADTTTSSEGTSTSFTLYCADEHGRTTDVGWFRPYVLVTLGYVVAAVALVVAVLAWRRLRRRRRAATPPDAADLSGAGVTGAAGAAGPGPVT